MASRSAAVVGKPQSLGCGPFRRVNSSSDPYDDDPSELQDALNMYIPDAANSSGMFQRPAFSLGAGSVISLGSARATSQFHYTSTTGTEYNFAMVSGKLYRISSTGAETDVTPVGVTIDNGLTTRLFMAQLNDQLIATDGVNKPWIGTNLGATPITGTYIDADGSGTSWTAFGTPFIQAGCVGFVLGATSSLSGLVKRIAILWSEPNQPAVGYMQTGYTDWWNLIQTSQRPITGVVGLNSGIVVFRDRGIGFIAGQLSGSFSSTTTNQLISDEIGLLAPATIARYRESIYFADQFGRPQLVETTTLREPQLWLQMRQYIESQTAAAGYATAVQNVAIGVIEPNLNLYLVAPFASSSLGVNNIPPNVAFAFDAKTGNYVGRWTLAASFEMTSFGVQLDANGAQQLWVLGPTAAGGGTNRVWQFQRLSAAAWTDTTPQTVSLTTNRLGYSSSIIWDAGDIGNLVTMNNAAVQIAIETPYTSNTVEGTPSPATSADGTYRCVVGLDIKAARGIQIIITPTLGSTQWGGQRWDMQAVPSKAGPEES